MDRWLGDRSIWARACRVSLTARTVRFRVARHGGELIVVALPLCYSLTAFALAGFARTRATYPHCIVHARATVVHGSAITSGSERTFGRSVSFIAGPPWTERNRSVDVVVTTPRDAPPCGDRRRVGHHLDRCRMHIRALAFRIVLHVPPAGTRNPRGPCAVRLRRTYVRC
jgi:hypothetical protein